MRRGAVTYVGTVRAGDEIHHGDSYVTVTKIRRAQGRKPKIGENLHLVTDTALVKLNSADPIRVRRAT